MYIYAIWPTMLNGLVEKTTDILAFADVWTRGVIVPVEVLGMISHQPWFKPLRVKWIGWGIIDLVITAQELKIKPGIAFEQADEIDDLIISGDDHLIKINGFKPSVAKRKADRSM